MNEITKVQNQNEVIRISSREVAEMMNIKRHGDLITKIEGINKIFENGKVRSQEYWIEHSNPRMMLKSVDEDEKKISPLYYSGQVRNM